MAILLVLFGSGSPTAVRPSSRKVEKPEQTPSPDISLSDSDENQENGVNMVPTSEHPSFTNLPGESEMNCRRKSSHVLFVGRFSSL